MSFARPWWLVALALLLPLILLHLRRPALTVREVADLAIWDRLAGPAESGDWRLRRPRHPVLLALQALALSALVLALAGPDGGTPRRPRRPSTSSTARSGCTSARASRMPARASGDWRERSPARCRGR